MVYIYFVYIHCMYNKQGLRYIYITLFITLSVRYTNEFISPLMQSIHLNSSYKLILMLTFFREHIGIEIE